MRIEIPLFDGFDEVDAIAPFEVLANASMGVEELTVELVGAHGLDVVTASHGMRVLVEHELSDAADLVLVPGGGWSGSRSPTLGVRREYDEGRLAARLKALHDGGAIMASVCTGALLLAQAHITDGRPATTHRATLKDLREMGADVDEVARVVDDGDLITCGGVTAGLDLALHLIEREWGSGLAEGVAGVMEHERRGPVRVTQPTSAAAAGARARASR